MEKFEIKGKLHGFFNPVLPLVYDDSLSYYEALQKLVEKINQFRELLNAHSEAIEEFADINGEQYDKFVEEVNKQYSQIQTQIDNVYQQINILKIRSDNTDTQIDDLHKHLIEIQQYLQEIPEKMEEIMQDLEEIRNNVAANKESIQNIVSGVTTVGKADNANTAQNSLFLGGIPASEYALKGEGGGSTVTVDTELSPTSTNPVENKSIYEGIAQASADLQLKINNLKQALIDGDVVVGEAVNSGMLEGNTYEEIQNYIKEQIAQSGGGSVVVDRALSYTSPNPVANFEITGTLLWLDSEIQEVRKLALAGGGGGSGSITVDSDLSLTSRNPVENRVITEHLNNVSNAIEVLENQVNELIAGGGAGITVDRKLDWESENPVANFEVSGAILWIDSKLQELTKLVETNTGRDGQKIEIDKELSTTSGNPVENRVITTKINQLDSELTELTADALTIDMVDKTLDVNSSHPVENRAVALQFDEVHDHVEENHAAFISAMGNLADGTTVVGKAKDSQTLSGKTIEEITSTSGKPTLTDITNLTLTGATLSTTRVNRVSRFENIVIVKIGIDMTQMLNTNTVLFNLSQLFPNITKAFGFGFLTLDYMIPLYTTGNDTTVKLLKTAAKYDTTVDCYWIGVVF